MVELGLEASLISSLSFLLTVQPSVVCFPFLQLCYFTYVMYMESCRYLSSRDWLFFTQHNFLDSHPSSFLFIAEQYSVVWIYHHLFNPWKHIWEVSSLGLWEIELLGTFVYMFCVDIVFISLRQMPQSAIAGLYGKSMFALIKVPYSVPQWLYYPTFPPAMCE